MDKAKYLTLTTLKWSVAAGGIGMLTLAGLLAGSWLAFQALVLLVQG